MLRKIFRRNTHTHTYFLCSSLKSITHFFFVKILQNSNAYESLKITRLFTFDSAEKKLENIFFKQKNKKPKQKQLIQRENERTNTN